MLGLKVADIFLITPLSLFLKENILLIFPCQQHNEFLQSVKIVKNIKPMVQYDCVFGIYIYIYIYMMAVNHMASNVVFTLLV